MIKSFKGNYRWLSNFTYVNVVLDGITYPSTEHAYQSAKSKEMGWKSICADKNNSPAHIKDLSKTIILEDWDKIKVSVMEKCVELKFSQEPFKTQLLDTGEEIIQEGNTWNDTFWGVNIITGEGENTLGKIIMNYRNKLNKK